MKKVNTPLIDTFETHWTDLVGFATSLKAPEPEDAVADAKLYAIENGYDERYEAKKALNPLSYARGLVYWEVMKQHKEETRHEAMKAAMSEGEDSYTMASLETSMDVQAALEQLPIAERVVAMACLIHGQSQLDAGRYFGKSQAWASEQLTEARRKLAKLLADYNK